MLYKIINTYADESDFILNLIDDHPYIGWYMLLRLGESDTTKATLTRRECCLYESECKMNEKDFASMLEEL